jgi:hypothetical protein
MTHREKQDTARGSGTGAGRSSPTDTELQWAFDTARKCIVIFAVMSAVVLATLTVVATAHGSVSVFMWVRASILLLLAPFFSRLVLHASQGQRGDLERLRVVTTVLPIAIVVVDLIPGVCPGWYAAMQAASAVPLIAVTAIARRRDVRTASPDSACRE